MKNRRNIKTVFVLLLLFISNSYCSAVASQEGGEKSEGEEADTGCGCALTRDSELATGTGAASYESIGNNGGGVGSSSCKTAAEVESPDAAAALSAEMVRVPGRMFYMGTSNPIMINDGEGPKRPVQVDSFYMDKYEVSNDQYKRFVDATNYRTDSELFGWSFVFIDAVPPKLKKAITQAVLGAEWWLPVNGSYWREPEGPGTDVFDSHRGNHPAVHISWTDADAFCKWRKSRLPTEAEWELAARGSGGEGLMFPWGNKLVPKGGKHRLNIWQGDFPVNNTLEDGHRFTAPVDAFGPQNDLGLFNMVGNAWEWVEDWWTTEHSSDLQHNPRGPPRGHEKVKKGGSFMCHRTFCYRYRSVARYRTTPDSATQNSGLRCARSLTIEEEEKDKDSRGEGLGLGKDDDDDEL